ncbi:uncharacterized protein AC631_01863 [Debaryomyces fabryi]|uniref:Phosphoribulokinase/uridine kinase domain-containing protein n=1 Tax=Debaryomyces fabryi TaxID=58627 RepID=A0A0V1Q2J8_9ASCO|nr:uncharacterized protein AC631_01863 [Debaryomyces fabryi]KSA02399.1 hypothetical protein AC631_01863 [Debaryomyces fabryi]CUM56522.1 unnamed protein product [Debaryomyces fabryi]
MPDKGPILILIGGGHAAGKKTTSNLLKEELRFSLPDVDLDIEIVDLDDYKEEDSKREYSTSKSAAITLPNNSDIKYPPLKPSRFNFDKLREYLLSAILKSKQKILIVHGLYALYDKDVRDISHIKVFLTSDPDTRLIRWIRRDVLDPNRNKTLESVINAYLQGARAEMSDFIFPTKEFADVIMPNGAEKNAIRLIVDGVMSLLPEEDQPQNMFLPRTNNLRPTVSFDGEKFDGQKGKFYELS